MKSLSAQINLIINYPSMFTSDYMMEYSDWFNVPFIYIYININVIYPSVNTIQLSSAVDDTK